MSSEENSRSRDHMPSGQRFGLESSSSVLLIWDYCGKKKNIGSQERNFLYS